MNLANNFEEILTAFNNHHVRYMIAGGYAVIFHGYGRTTGDLDLWIMPSEENKTNIIKVFKELKYNSDLVNYLENQNFSIPFSVKIGDEPIQVDIFNAISGINYDDAERNSIAFQFSENLSARFIHLHDLIVNKMSTGRLRDAADVDELHKINIHSKDENILGFFKRIFGNK